MEQTEVQSAPEPEVQKTQEEVISALLISDQPLHEDPDAQLKAIVEAAIYLADEPLTADQIATALKAPAATVGRILEELTAEYNKPEHGLTVREIAGGFKMSTKPEHHEAIRTFVKNLKPPLKLSLPALETLALIAYKQPITSPEIMEVRGVQGAGVIKTLLDRKLIAMAGKKAVVGKPLLYKTTKEFLVQFGLKDLSELPSLKEFEELGRLSMGEGAVEEPAEQPEPQTAAEETVEAVAEQPESQPEAAAEPAAEPEPEPEPPASESVH
jgi:segregation and condensation protein B